MPKSTTPKAPPRTLRIELPEDVACRLAARLRNEIVLDGRVTRGGVPRRGHQQAEDDRTFVGAVKIASAAARFGLAAFDPYDGSGRVLGSFEPDCGDCEASSDDCYVGCALREARYLR